LELYTYATPFVASSVATPGPADIKFATTTRTESRAPMRATTAPHGREEREERATHEPRAGVLSGASGDSLWDVVRSLARAKLQNPKICEAARVKRIFLHDRLDLFSALRDRQDDAAVSRDLSSRNDEYAGSVVLVQERDVRGHVRVDVSKIGFVN
jgi:hypothetical protein